MSVLPERDLVSSVERLDADELPQARLDARRKPLDRRVSAIALSRGSQGCVARPLCGPQLGVLRFKTPQQRLHAVRRQRPPRLLEPFEQLWIDRKRHGRRELDARKPAAPKRVRDTQCEHRRILRNGASLRTNLVGITPESSMQKIGPRRRRGTEPVRADRREGGIPEFAI